MFDWFRSVGSTVKQYLLSENAQTAKRRGRVFIYVTAGTVVAAAVVNVVHSAFPNGTREVAVISLAVTLRYYKDIHELTVDLWRYWKNNVRFDFAKQFPALVTPLTVFMFGFVLVNPDNQSPEESILAQIANQFDRIEGLLVDGGNDPDNVHVVVPEPDRYIFFHRPMLDRTTATMFGDAVFPLLFENAELSKDHPPENEFDISKVKWLEKGDNGVRVREDHKKDLRDLLIMLSPCTIEPVSLTITGSASSLPFDEYGSIDISDSLNVYAANTRAFNVQNAMNTLIADLEANDDANRFFPENISTKVHEHDDIIDMKRHLIINDRPREFSRNDSEGLTRAVYIKIQYAGACEPERYDQTLARSLNSISVD